MKVKSPKVVKQKQKRTKKLDPVGQKSAKIFNVFVSPKSLQCGTSEDVCLKKAIKNAIKCAEGSRLQSVGTLRFRFSNESHAKAAIEETQKLNSAGIAITVGMAPEIYDEKKRCLYIGRKANVDGVLPDVKKEFKTDAIKRVKRFNKFDGLLILSFSSVQLAENADKASFLYDGKIRRCRPSLKYRQPVMAVHVHDKPAAKKQKLNNGASVKTQETKKTKKTKKPKVEESMDEDEDEEPQNGHNGSNHKNDDDDDDDGDDEE